MLYISPSMLSCDFSRMAEEAVAMEKAGAEMLHLDIMDGHFVPNITFGVPVIQCLRPTTSLVFDVHLMITHPLQYVEDFAKAGANIITFHIESDSPVEETLQTIKNAGAKTGLAVKPNTPIERVYPFLEQLDMVLVMAVEPGFGGQSFRDDMMGKIVQLKQHCEKIGKKDLLIQVDGGISIKTAKKAVDAGANVLVSGSALFSCSDYEQGVSALRKASVEG